MPNLWFFIARTEGKNFNQDDHVHYAFSAEEIGITAEDLEEAGPIEALRMALETAYSMGLPKGSHRSGCFQVQSEFGIWSQKNEKRIDLSTDKKAALVSFKTWEQMEQEEMVHDSCST
jgi:hypothetical protein